MNRLSDKILAMAPKLLGGKTHAELRKEQSKNWQLENGFYFYKGVKYSESFYSRHNLEAVQNVQVRDDDVFVITYPKSGTHWLIEIVGFVLADGSVEDIERVPDTLEATVDRTRSVYELLKKKKSPRQIYSHLHISVLPPQILNSGAKVICLARNPKDMMTSGFKFPMMRASAENMESYFWNNLFGTSPYGSWFDHVLDYWKHRNDDNFLFLKYEDLHKDLRGHICQIAKFVGKDLTDDVIDRIVKQVAFTEMQKSYKRAAPDGSTLTHFEGVPHLQKGKVGSWKDAFTVAESALFDEIYADKMKDTGLVFDFELS